MNILAVAYLAISSISTPHFPPHYNVTEVTFRGANSIFFDIVMGGERGSEWAELRGKLKKMYSPL